MSTSPNTPQSNIKVRRAAVDSVDLYEVKEHELIQLEKGSEADIYLNFAIFLFSISFSCILTLISADFKRPVYQTFAVVIIVVGLIGSILLLLLWMHNRKKTTNVVKQIRDRLPAEIVVTTEQDSIEIEKSKTIEEKTDPPISGTTIPAG